MDRAPERVGERAAGDDGEPRTRTGAGLAGGNLAGGRHGAYIAAMTDEPDNLVLVYLRRIDAKVDALADEVRDLKGRVGRLETSLAQVHVTLAEHSNRMDRIELRLDRIERRLDLAEAPLVP